MFLKNLFEILAAATASDLAVAYAATLGGMATLTGTGDVIDLIRHDKSVYRVMQSNM